MLAVTIAASGDAEGELYVDDGDTTAHAGGDYSLYKLVYKGSAIECSKAGGQGKNPAHSVERVVVYGLAKAPTTVHAEQVRFSTHVQMYCVGSQSTHMQMYCVGSQSTHVQMYCVSSRMLTILFPSTFCRCRRGSRLISSSPTTREPR